jgi:hypothetical protein
MEPDPVLLARLLCYAALLGATVEYAEILKRRVVARRVAAETAELQATGLGALVRICLDLQDA